MVYCDIKWFALKTNRDRSVVFEIAPKTAFRTLLLIMRPTPFLLRILAHSNRYNNHPLFVTVELTNRFKGLDVIARVPKDLWTEVCNIVQKVVIKTIPQKKKCKKEK